jgi:hypothetical protein
MQTNIWRSAVDNRHFDPHGFGLGGAATMGLAVGATVHSIAGNLAAVAHERREMLAAIDIQDTSSNSSRATSSRCKRWPRRPR